MSERSCFFIALPRIFVSVLFSTASRQVAEESRFKPRVSRQSEDQRKIKWEREFEALSIPSRFKEF